MFSPPPRKSVVVGLPLLWNGAAQRTPAAADVEHERDARVLRARPQRLKSGWVGERSPRRHRRHQDRAAAEPDRLVAPPRSVRCRIAPGDEADGDEALVMRAEVRHGAVVRARAAVEELRSSPSELCRREGAEHELLLEAEQVERARPLGRDRRRRARSSPWRLISVASSARAASARRRGGPPRRPPPARPAARRRRGTAGGCFSRIPGSAYAASQSPSSIRWLSASQYVRPSAYGIGPLPRPQARTTDGCCR